MIKFTIKEDFRKFKKGDVYEFDVKPGKILHIIGPNASGKSTLLRGIRGIKDSLKQANKKAFDGMTSAAQEMTYHDTMTNIDIEGLDEYDEVFVCDQQADNPLTFEHSATASGLIMGGGMMMQRKSNGEMSMLMQAKFISQILTEHKEGNKMLIIMDEMDDGFDIAHQIKYGKILDKIYGERWPDATIIHVTHNFLSAISPSKVYETSIYDMEFKMEYDTEFYKELIMLNFKEEEK